MCKFVSIILLLDFMNYKIIGETWRGGMYSPAVTSSISVLQNGAPYANSLFCFAWQMGSCLSRTLFKTVHDCKLRPSNQFRLLAVQISMWNLGGQFPIISQWTSGQHPLGGEVGSCAERIPSPFSVAGGDWSRISLAASSRDACSSSCIIDLWKVKVAPFIHGLDRGIALSSSIRLTACNKSKQKTGR